MKVIVTEESLATQHAQSAHLPSNRNDFGPGHLALLVRQPNNMLAEEGHSSAIRAEAEMLIKKLYAATKRPEEAY